MHGAFVKASSLVALAAGLLLAAPAARTQQTVRIPEKDKALVLRTTPVYAVGKAEGNEWEMFTRVSGVAFDRNDNLYVLDSGGARVLVFDRAGRFVRQVGKKGGGPGEFAAPVGITVQGDGTLIVSDLGHRSYSLFGRDGKYVRSVPFPDEWMPALANNRLAAHPRGGVVATVSPAPMRGMGGGMRGLSGQSNPVVWQPFTQGARPVTLFNATTEVTSETEGGPQAGGQQRVSFTAMSKSFSPPVAFGLLPAGNVVVAHTPGYTLKVMGNDGRVARYIQKPMRVRKVTDRDRERERERTRQQMISGEGLVMVTVGGGRGRRPGPSRERIEEMVANMEFEDVIPAIQDIRTDAAGRIWVERTGEVWGDPGPIDVVTADGRYLGTVTGQRLPDAFSPSGRAAYIQEDDDGVQRVVVRQLPRL